MDRKIIRRMIKEMPGGPRRWRSWGSGGDGINGSSASGSNTPKVIALSVCKLVGVMLLTFLLTMAFFSFGMGSESVLMIYILAVLIVSVITPNYIYGVLAALIASLTFDIFIIEPYDGLNFGAQIPITLITMLIVTVLTSSLTMLLKHQAYIAHKREQRADLMFELSQALADAKDSASVAVITTDCLSSIIKSSIVMFTADPKSAPLETCAPAVIGDPAELFTERELTRVHRLFVNGTEDALESGDELPVYYEPIVLGNAVLGVIGIRCVEKTLSLWNQDLVSLISQIAAHALELQRAREIQNELRIGSEREKMRSNLLRSISHDLRTPLTSILGASAAIYGQPLMPEETRNGLLTDMQDNTKWLIRMVESILTVTRISQEAVQLHKSLEAAEEIISQSVTIVRARFPECLIHVKIPDELIMVPMDATLISQVIINLLENAVRNSDEGALVLFTLTVKNRFAYFEVSDRGGGIPAHILDNLFEIHARDEIAADSSRGFGIGLSICRTIILAHGGTIEGHNREKGGAMFTFMLPLDDTADPADGKDALGGREAEHGNTAGVGKEADHGNAAGVGGSADRDDGTAE